MLGTSLLVDAVPARHRHGDTDLDTLFRVARGRAPTGPAAAAAEMTKWFNTNYHYLVPEFYRDQRFKLGWSQLFDEVEEAKALGLPVKAVLLGPVSYLWLGKGERERLLPPRTAGSPADRLPGDPGQTGGPGVEWVQTDEPALALDLPDEWRLAYLKAYERLSGPLQAAAHHLLRVRGPSAGHHHQFEGGRPAPGSGGCPRAARDPGPAPAGPVGTLGGCHQRPQRLACQPGQAGVDPQGLERKAWRAPLGGLLLFLAAQPGGFDLGARAGSPDSQLVRLRPAKCYELGLLSDYLDGGALDKIEAYSQPIVDRESDSRVHKKAVQSRLASLTNSDFDRQSAYPVRADAQRSDLKLPLLPTTTIGSFPQTSEIRVLRQDWRAGRIDDQAYEAGIQAQIRMRLSARRPSGWTCWCTARPSATTWWSISGSCWTALPSPALAGYRAMAPAASKPPVITRDIDRPTP